MKRDTARPELLAAGEATLALGTWVAGLRYADLPPAVASAALPAQSVERIISEVGVLDGAGPAMSQERP